MKRILLLTTRRILLTLWLSLLFSALATTPGGAHGGVVIDTGYTDHFEWLVSIDPYPTLLGDATLTLLVYDIATYEPVNDFTMQLYRAAPDAPRPCCQPAIHDGPIALVIDPKLYPGDYSNVINFDQPGDWELQFVATAPERMSTKSFTIVVPLQVNATMGGTQRIPINANETPDLAATSTVFAANVAQARQSNSPLVLPASPLATPPTEGAAPQPAVTAVPATAVTGGTNWWLWGGLGLLPIILIGWFVVNSGSRDKEPSDHD